MTFLSIADLVRICHDVDVIKGRTCGCCWWWLNLEHRLTCFKGHDPYGPQDGCDEWMERPLSEYPPVQETHQLASCEPDGAA